MLHFGLRPPFSYPEFLHKCAGLIPDNDLILLKELPGFKEDILGKSSPVIRKWIAWDWTLRDELVKLRASRKHIPAQRDLRKDDFSDLSLSHVAANAFRNLSILEGERILDLARWEALEEFSQGHYFDLDFLIIYAYKLLILERWERIRVSDKKELLEGALS